MQKPRLLRYWHISIFFLSLVGFVWGLYNMASFLLNAPQLEVQKISVSGLSRVEENEVLARAGDGIRGNILRVDLQEVRTRVEEILWVRHATVQRVLPDQILIKVVEREPVGIARLRGETFHVDIDGTILDPDPMFQLNFPVLDGLWLDDPEGNAKKVAIYSKVVEEIGKSELSEVHINDSGEVSVVQNNDPVLIQLGKEDFRNRWFKYVRVSGQIKEKYPEVTAVDLRFRNQIIIRTRQEEFGGKILWDEKKKTL